MEVRQINIYKVNLQTGEKTLDMTQLPSTMFDYAFAVKRV